MDSFGWKILISFIVALLVGFLIGFIVVSYSVGDDFSYKEASIMTCEYSNNLTDIINSQSESLTTCSGYEFETLEKLDCELLKEGQ